YNLTGGDLTGSEMAAINAQAGRIANYINNNGALFAMGEQDTIPMQGSWDWLRALYPNIVTSAAGSGANITLTPDGVAAFPGLNNDDLTGSVFWHSHFTGDLGNLRVLATALQGSTTRQVILGNQGGSPCTLEITSFNPTSGSANTNVAITGKGFTGVNSVKFANNVAATFTVNSDSQITATVPNGAVTGPITVSKPDCGAQSNTNFAVGPPLTRIVRVVCGTASPGGAVMAPIVLDSQGDENAIGFSLNFDPAILGAPMVALGGDSSGGLLNVNTSQVAQGRLGIALSLPSGRTFSVGARQIVVVSFTVSSTTTATSTRVDFGDAPIRREVSNVNAQALITGYEGCQIIIEDGYEADVTPRPTGNKDGTVTITDWVQVGRFTAGLDTAATGGEFQRADCAPREVKGNGQLTITDWVQAGRYVAGLDPVQTAGGPTSPTALAMEGIAQTNARGAHARAIRVLNATFQRGQPEGDENALGFSLNFDPGVLGFVSASVGSGLDGAALNVNANQAANGRLGVALALPAGQKMRAGKQTIVTLRFNALSSSNATTALLSFGDQPIRRQLSDVNAVEIAASYSDGSVTIANAVTSVSAASFKPEVAVESIVAAFGARLATATVVTTVQPLPTSLAGTTVKVKDSAGAERLAPLFFVAPAQVNYQMPPGTAPGAARVTVTSGDGAVSVGTANVASVAPSLFAANADGQGVVAGVVLRVGSDGSQRFEPVSRFDPSQNRFVSVPIDLGPEGEQVFLILSGMGFRHRSALSAVSCQIGEANADVLYAGATPGFVGLDQSNLRLPRSLAGRGEADIVLTVDGKTANVVKVNIR
ncbi:MAG: IPT/TIG domain-containing protein, partial [Blastocatellia bacterium]